MKIDVAPRSEVCGYQQHCGPTRITHVFACDRHDPIDVFIKECDQVFLARDRGFLKVFQRFLRNQKKLLEITVLKTKSYVSIARQNWNYRYLHHVIGSIFKRAS